MSTIGYVHLTNNNGDKHLTGYIQTLQFSIMFELKLNHTATNPNAPQYLIIAKNAEGGSVCVGGAWKKISNKKPGEPPFEFLSLTLDDPSFPNPLNVAAFPNEAGGYDITFRRRMDRKAA